MITQRLMNRQNFYSSRTANSADVVRAGFAQLSKVADELNARSALIVCHTKANLDGFIKDVIGAPAVKALQHGTKVNLSQTCRLIFHNERSLPTSAAGSPVLACFPNAKLLDKLDGLFDVSALIVLPWHMDDIAAWLAAHDAQDILTGASSASQSVLNPVVERALKWLVSSINVSTGISHPNDKGRAIFAFKTLKGAKESYDPVQVKAWLVRNGMDPRHASEIEAIAAKPSARRSASKLGFDSARALDQWRKQNDD